MNSPYHFKALREELKQTPNKQILFKTANATIQPGFHVTEIKRAQVSSLDCGQGEDQWQESIVQLLNGRLGSSAAPMPVSKLLNILQSLDDADEDALFFEHNIDGGPLVRTPVTSVSVSGDDVVIQLMDGKPQCKAFERFVNKGSEGGNSGCCS